MEIETKGILATICCFKQIYVKLLNMAAACKYFKASGFGMTCLAKNMF